MTTCTRAILTILICCPAGCGTSAESLPSEPARTVCLDFTETNFPVEWRHEIYNKMDEDFGPHGFRITYHELGDCDYRITFGGDDAARWGIAHTAEGEAVVFTDAILKWADGYQTDVFLQGVANAAAHELGHLLGYNHTDDPTDVMSVPESASVRLFDDQRFYP